MAGAGTEGIRVSLPVEGSGGTGKRLTQLAGEAAMLVTFTCKAYADITMFGDVALGMLNMMGHSGTVPGAILAEDVPAALERLKRSIGTARATPARNGESGKARDDDPEEPPVSLAHRALPLIELLAAAARENCDVMWK